MCCYDMVITDEGRLVVCYGTVIALERKRRLQELLASSCQNISPLADVFCFKVTDG